MEYEDKLQINRIEAKIDAIFMKVCPELFQKDETKEGGKKNAKS